MKVRVTMGFLNFIFGKKNKTVYQCTNSDNASNINELNTVPINRGVVTARKVNITAENYDSIFKEFIAFDTETTGLSADNDVIIEVGAVRFVEGKKVSSYGTLVNEGRSVPYEASSINHITTKMLQQDGKSPEEAYEGLVNFFDQVMNGDICICAHNAAFDMKFLTNTLERYGYNGCIKYIDTLALSRRLIKGLSNYKQDTVANYFNLRNQESHRAVSDAETCGYILNNLLGLKYSEIEQEKIRNEKRKLNDEELETAAIILNLLKNNNENIRFYKNSAGCIDVIDVFTIFKFKISNRKRYFVIPKRYAKGIDNIEECPKSQGRENVRVLFEDPFELKLYGELLSRIYENMKQKNIVQISKYESDYLLHANLIRLTNEDINKYLVSAIKRKEDNLAKKAKLKVIEEKNALEKVAKEKKKLEKQEATKKKEILKEKEKVLQEKIKQKLLNNEEISKEEIRQIVQISSSQRKRAVLQMDDMGTLIAIYESVSSASNQIGISTKTIRDAANGKYIHAGGFCWKYADEYE